MSTNLHIYALREVIVKKTGSVRTESRLLPIWQTPTVVTEEIMKSDDKLQAYFDWVLSLSVDEEEQVLDLDDNLLYTRIVNYGKEHIQELRDLVNELNEDGFELKFEAW